jgi:ABC-2 type transport system ATP-binding protein
VQIRFRNPDALAAAAQVVPGARDDAALSLTVASDGTARSLRRVLDRLPDDDAVDDVALHSPDLDDVFLALTGHGTTPPGTDPPEDPRATIRETETLR